MTPKERAEKDAELGKKVRLFVEKWQAIVIQKNEGQLEIGIPWYFTTDWLSLNTTEETEIKELLEE